MTSWPESCTTTPRSSTASSEQPRGRCLASSQFVRRCPAGAGNRILPADQGFSPASPEWAVRPSMAQAAPTPRCRHSGRPGTGAARMCSVRGRRPTTVSGSNHRRSSPRCLRSLPPCPVLRRPACATRSGSSISSRGTPSAASNAISSTCSTTSTGAASIRWCSASWPTSSSRSSSTRGVPCVRLERIRGNGDLAWFRPRLPRHPGRPSRGVPRHALPLARGAVRHHVRRGASYARHRHDRAPSRRSRKAACGGGSATSSSAGSTCRCCPPNGPRRSSSAGPAPCAQPGHRRTASPSRPSSRVTRPAPCWISRSRRR